MNWQNSFDLIVVVNLAEREDRRIQIKEEMELYGIEYVLYEAIKDENGIKGLLLTMKKLFTECVEKNYQNILVLEDDVYFVGIGNPNDIMPKCLEQLPKDYLMLHLGYNLLQKPIRMSDSIIKIISSYATHAIAYSKEAMKLILPLLDEVTPYDVLLMKNIHILGRCYGTFPVLCSQREGYSSIENKNMDWGKLMAVTYRMFTGDFIPNAKM